MEVEPLARPLALLVVLALGTASCGGIEASAPADHTADNADSAMTRVSAFGVSALVPRDWVVQTTDDAMYAVGVSASPGPLSDAAAVPEQGLVATRLDATEVGVPSDLYYLAAKGPVIERVTDHARCTVTQQRIFVDHAPASMTGARRSPGDFVARATGTCGRSDAVTRWSYFVAAPGYGPARETGIPGSGLYVIVVSTPQARRAGRTLARMLRSVRFGEDTARDFVQAVRTSV
ncbi:MAG: hypothetical protein ABJB55_00510 [Actinomycetota bacterium]